MVHDVIKNDWCIFGRISSRGKWNMFTSNANSSTQGTKWVLKEEDFDKKPIFSFPRHTCIAVLMQEGRQAGSSAANPRPGKRVRRVVNVELSLRWGDLNIREDPNGKLLHGLSLSRVTIEADDRNELNLITLRIPGLNPVRLMFHDKEEYDE